MGRWQAHGAAEKGERQSLLESRMRKTPGRVRQIEAKALEKMRKAMQAQGAALALPSPA